MKKALLVGINSYTQAPLNGCVNDVNLMSSILKAKGFDCKVLTEQDATKQNILEEMEKLFAGSTKEDSLVFHYSGHGSQVPDLSGDEADGLDECILPIDFDWDHVIIDDNINDLITKHVKEATIEIILDACHSGSGTRNVLLNAKPTETISRFVQPPREIFAHVKNAYQVPINKIALNNVITWSGCKDDQTSADAFIDGFYNGAFTFALSKCLSNNIQRNLIIDCVQHYMKANGYSQEPQLTCDRRSIACEAFSNEKSLLKSFKFW